MAVEAPKLAALASSKRGDLATLQRAMREDGFEMLQYIFTAHGLVIWHTSASGSHVRLVMMTRRHIVSTIAKLSASLRNPHLPFDESAAKELYYRMIGPVRQHIGGKKLLILPVPEVGTLPFQALIDPSDGRFLGEKFQMTYAPSGTVLLGLEKTKPLGRARALALADPQLPGARQEMSSIRQTFDGRGVFRADRRPLEADVKRAVAQADVVHLAVHGNFAKAEPMLSYLELEAGAGEDGMLTATEMFALPLVRKPLVVLSACETGRTGTTASGEMLGMSRALLYAGANALLLSQWRVDSDATARWMKAFYRAALSSSLAEAAAAASDQLRVDPATRHPFYWAPFLLTAR
jgi:CHAT domain-containing protein